MVQQIDVLNSALDVPILIAVPSSERGSPVQHLLVVTGAVDDDVPALLDHILGEYPVEAICEFRRLIKGDVVFEKEGFDEIVVDDHAVD